jgi:hypothetical protein
MVDNLDDWLESKMVVALVEGLVTPMADKMAAATEEVMVELTDFVMVEYWAAELVQ